MNTVTERDTIDSSASREITDVQPNLSCASMFDSLFSAPATSDAPETKAEDTNEATTAAGGQDCAPGEATEVTEGASGNLEVKGVGAEEGKGEVKDPVTTI